MSPVRPRYPAPTQPTEGPVRPTTVDRCRRLASRVVMPAGGWTPCDALYCSVPDRFFEVAADDAIARRELRVLRDRLGDDQTIERITRPPERRSTGHDISERTPRQPQAQTATEIRDDCFARLGDL